MNFKKVQMENVKNPLVKMVRDGDSMDVSWWRKFESVHV